MRDEALFWNLRARVSTQTLNPKPGTALAQRVSASLLVASGLGDTVARSLHDYADIAAALARPARGTLYTKPFNKSNMLTPISCNPQP